MKSNMKKISILVTLLFLILCSFILCSNKEKNANNINDIRKKEALIQDFLTYRNMNEKVIDEANTQYDFIENGNIIITEYFGYEDSIIVPKELDNHKVEKIDPRAFINNENLEIIKIPIEIAQNIDELGKFEISRNLSNDEYIIYISTKEYTEEYLKYIKLPDEEKAKVIAIPRKFVTTLEDIYANETSTVLEGSDVSIPSSYDLRTRINVQAENQEQLGICYSYATIKSIETNLLLTKGITRNFSEIDLAVKSKQFSGGHFYDSYSKYLQYGDGPVTEAAGTLLNQSYLTSQRYSNTVAGNIYNACYSDNSQMNEEQTTTAINTLNAINAERNYYVMSYKRFATISGTHKKDPSYTNAVIENRNLIKEHIMKNGSAYTYIKSPQSGTNYYDSGSIAVQCQTNENPDTGGHCVSIIGWNDNFNKSNFPSSWGVSNNGAWLVLNSWGNSWGNNDGTWWISYDDFWVEYDTNIVKEVSQGKVNVNNANITLSHSSTPTYDGISKQPYVYFRYNDTTYYKGTDYTVEYINNINAGTATVKITGIGRFTGTVNKEFTISPKSIPSATLVTSSYTYDGTEKTPAVTVTDGSKTLTLNTDYTLTYSNNTNVGIGTVTIKGTGNYTGTIIKKFTISAKAINSTTITLDKDSYTYDGTAKTPAVTIKDGDKVLTLDTDYTLTYSNNTNTGTATITITGKGNYTGSTNKTFTILPKSITSSTITLATDNYVYDGITKTPAVTVIDGSKTLILNTDYTITYSNNTNAGTATVTIVGKGNYAESINKPFTISAKSISSATVTLEKDKYTYDKTEKTPTVTVIDENKTLALNTDYTLTYSNNTNTGTATATITGKGNYTESINKTFTISAKSITSTTVILEEDTYTYDGIAKNPTVTINDGDKILTLNTDYTLEYSNNTNTGTATIAIIGKGNYKENINIPFIILAKAISSATVTLEEDTYTYDGTTKTPTVTINDGDKILTLNTDYTIEYSNNINAGTGTITIIGKGNYKETRTINFKINKADIAVNIVGANTTYNGTPHGITVNVITPSSGAIVKYGSTENDCSLLSSPTYTEIGTYTIYYQVKSDNYNDLQGSQILTINNIDITAPTFTLEPNEFIYDGTEKLPEFTLKNEDYILQKDIDYTVQYIDNINVGTATIIITGKGHYNGTLEKTFTISPQDLSSGKATLVENVIYNKEAQTPEVEVKNELGTTLIPEKDYITNYNNNTNVGTATVEIIGQGNYTGTIIKNFIINNADIQVEANDYEITYDKKEHGIEVNIMTELEETTIKYGLTEEQCDLDDTPTYTDVGTYTVFYEIHSNNYNTFKGNVTIKITAKNINSSILTLDTEEHTYTGMAKTPNITVKDLDTILNPDTDYITTYTNNINAGTATAAIIGKGNYEGSKSISFIIEKGTPNYTIPSGLVVAYGSTLENVTLPSGFSWEDDLNTDVGEIGLNTFKCTYTPEDTNNYNNVTELEVTLKITEKLSVNIEEFITQATDDEQEIYITNINPDTSLDEIKNNIKTNGTITIYESDGTTITNNSKNIKTGMKLKIETEAETINYIFSVTR